MWFIVVCNFDHCDDMYSVSVREQTTLNHIRFVKYRPWPISETHAS